MLRLPPFTYAAPQSVDAALALLADTGSRPRLLAGGTDLLPNLKHGIEEAGTVVSLSQVPGLDAIRETSDGGLELGALVTLETLAAHPGVASRYPALAHAAGLVAGPHHRRMGTLGGNVCLNTRCVYINQTHFWRQSLGYCLKKDGSACHVVKGGKRCVAAASNDTAPPLSLLGAELLIASAARGERRVPLADFYVQDGVHNKALEPDELLTHVLVPPPAAGLHSSYAKLRPRDSIDFPRLSVAVAFRLEGGVLRDLGVVLSALASTPVRLRKLSEAADGQAPHESLWEVLGALAFKQCHPLTSIDGDAAWRREMVPVYVKRALRAALAEGASRAS
ncbi:MAG: 4-hydroxybenzoyl-CoA reductase subunit beta [Planctomycetota bacterium]|nr:MAG: 4-hydroxybenzoyl-CoA reductase subunit beta [Planctomycetota bacterium]